MSTPTSGSLGGGDDVLYFANSSSNTDLFDSAEDPTGKGTKPLRHHQTMPVPRQKSSLLEPGIVTSLTPGANLIP
jgi:hypothetical protein